MDRSNIKDYILQNKGRYSKESIMNQLKNAGASESQIESVYNEVMSSSSNGSNVETKSGLALGLVLGGVLIPIIGLFMMIYGLVLAHRARKIKKDDGMALAALIIGYILLIIPLLLIFSVIGVVAFQSWFQTYNSGLIADVEQRSANTEGLNVEMVQLLYDGNVEIYLKNPSNIDIYDINVKVGTCTDSVPTLGKNSVTNYVFASDCGITQGETTDVTLITSNGIYREKEIVR